MAVPGFALVGQLALRLSADGRDRRLYLAQDRSSGRIFSLPRKLALALHRLRAINDGDEEARRDMGAEELRDAYGFLRQMSGMRDEDQLRRKPFNPVFMSIPLIDLAPWQPRLAPLARRMVAPWYLWLLALMALACFMLGIRSDWAIMESYRNVFSLQALATFGIVAPFLKVIHELGHALTATRYGVRLRKGGLYVIGLYPMPYVDCSEADVSAHRRHRLAISAAGIAVDVGVGLVAFIAWYLVEGSYLQVLVGNIFVFSTLNSLLFNANPIVKLDGYYVMCDLIRSRNLATRAAAVFKEARVWVMTLGRAGSYPQAGRHWAMLGYAVLGLLYRLRILFVIGFALMPRYLGLGVVLVAWGAIAMFAVPMMRDRVPKVALEGSAKRARTGMRLGLLAALVIALAFVKAPHVLVLPVALDTGGRYQVTARTAGFLQTLARAGDMQPGTPLARLENPLLADRAQMLEANLDGARLAYETVRGDHPAKAAVAREQVETLEQQLQVSRYELAELELTSGSGRFLPRSGLARGAYLASGEPLGAFLPDTGRARLTGQFPERYVQKFQQGLTGVELRHAGQYEILEISTTELLAIPAVDRVGGGRSYKLVTEVGTPPAALAGQPGLLRLRFEAEPLAAHVVFWFRGLVVRFREAQIADRESW